MTADRTAVAVCYMEIVAAACCDDGLDRERVVAALERFFDEATLAAGGRHECEDCGGNLYYPAQCTECAELQACTDNELHEQDHGPGRT